MVFTRQFWGIPLIILGVLITANLFLLSKQQAGIILNPLFFSQLCALVGTILLAFSFVLSSRAPSLENWFGGLDKIYKVHRTLGGLSYTFLLEHPLLLILQQLPNKGAIARYLLPSSNLAYNFGVLAFWVMTFFILLTLFVRLPYQFWLATHKWLGSVSLFSLAHVYLITSDTSRYLPLRVWVIGWIAIAVYSLAYRYWLHRLFGLRYSYEVKSVTELGDVVRMELCPLKNKLVHDPGQFVFLETKNRGEQHPFSVASYDPKGNIVLMAKSVGDFTLQLKQLIVGTKVTLQGPHGKFLSHLKPNDRIVCIAGGIGITPFLSLVSAWKEKPALIESLFIFYAVSKPEEAIVENEIIHVHASSLSGRLTGSTIIDQTKLLKPTKYCLCGPQQMMFNLCDQLINLGINRRNIIYEDFSFK